MWIELEVWVRGGVNGEVLGQRLVERANQALIDYALETCILKLPLSPPDPHYQVDSRNHFFELFISFA